MHIQRAVMASFAEATRCWMSWPGTFPNNPITTTLTMARNLLGLDASSLKYPSGADSITCKMPLIGSPLPMAKLVAPKRTSRLAIDIRIITEWAHVTAHMPPHMTIPKVTTDEINIAIPKGMSKLDAKSCPMARNCEPIHRKNDGTWITQLSRSAAGPNSLRKRSATVAAFESQNRPANTHPVRINVAPQAIGSSKTRLSPP